MSPLPKLDSYYYPDKPSRVDSIIDGQQRISTLAMLASLIYQRLENIEREIKGYNSEEYSDLLRNIVEQKNRLLSIFTVDFRSGDPRLKPKIIRGMRDFWTYDGDHKYSSDVAKFLAKVIRTIGTDQKAEELNSDSPVYANLKLMEGYLDKIVTAHVPPKKADLDDDFHFPSASDIIGKIESSIWIRSKTYLRDLVNNSTDTSKERNTLCNTVQLLALAYYLLDKCCVTSVKSRSENWAFDMFQSLNSTGTPLTAFETFKPVVIRSTKPFTGSSEEIELGKVEKLLDKLQEAKDKNRRTDELLMAFAYTYGHKLERRLSHQLKWLKNQYANTNPQYEFVRRLGTIASYLQAAMDFDIEEYDYLSFLKNKDKSDRELATFCVMYLESINNQMSRPILGLFYDQILQNKPNASDDFTQAAKALAAFFTLWRSAYKNTAGIENVYRQILSGRSDSKKHTTYPPMSWKSNSAPLSVTELKIRLRLALADKFNASSSDDIFNNWFASANQNLSDDSKHICRFILLLMAQFAVPSENSSLLTMATAKSGRFLTPSRWVGENLKEIEHVAPVENDKTWDADIYRNLTFKRIGNLMLLHRSINASASNKSWRAKWVYYASLSEPSEEKFNTLSNQYSIDIKPDIRNILKLSERTDLAIAVSNVGIDGRWDKNLIDERSKNILELVWKILWDWLN